MPGSARPLHDLAREAVRQYPGNRLRATNEVRRLSILAGHRDPGVTEAVTFVDLAIRELRQSDPAAVTRLQELADETFAAAFFDENQATEKLIANARSGQLGLLAKKEAEDLIAAAKARRLSRIK